VVLSPPRTVKLVVMPVGHVPHDRQQVDTQALDVERYFPHRLGGVAVEERPVFVAEGGEFGDRLEGAGLVVGGHHGHQHRVLGEGGGQGGRLDESVPVDGQDRHPCAVQPLQRAGGLQHSRVLRGLGDHVEVRAAGGQDCAAQREEVGFGSRCGENDLAGPGTDQVGDLGAGFG